jgi:hypothetical protein
MGESDKNTKFFHAQCSHRQQKNMIQGLRDDMGVWHSDMSKMSEMAVNYFQQIFTSSNPSEEALSTCLEGMEEVISDDMNAALLAEFSANEISQALK